jgi:heat shock protein HtpX
MLVELLGANGVGVLGPRGNLRGGPSMHVTVACIAGHVTLPRVCFFGPGAVEIDVSSGQPGTVLRCRIEGHIQGLQQLRRRLNRALNHQRSGQVIAGMVLLLTLCGWIVGGEEGARSALAAGMWSASEADAVSPDSICRQFGAHVLRPSDVPALFQVLDEIGRRAGLSCRPELYYLPSPDNMNAYAIGASERSAIILAEGLLRGMTVDETAGILAHEIAHIRNDDAWVMTWATGLCRAIVQAWFVGLQGRRNQNAVVPGMFTAVLCAAPAISQLLWLGLSRIRESDADAVALDLVDDPKALIAALGKLERHHAGASPDGLFFRRDGFLRYLCSHPATSERVDVLMKLAA